MSEEELAALLGVSRARAHRLCQGLEYAELIASTSRFNPNTGTRERSIRKLLPLNGVRPHRMKARDRCSLVNNGERANPAPAPSRRTRPLSASEPMPSLETTSTTTTPRQEKARDVNVPAVPALNNGEQQDGTADGNGGTAGLPESEVVVVNDTARDGDGNDEHRQETAECGERPSADEPPTREEIRRRMLEVGFEVAPRRKGRKPVADVIRDFGEEACWHGLQQLAKLGRVRNPAGTVHDEAEAYAKQHGIGMVGQRAGWDAITASLQGDSSTEFIRQAVEKHRMRVPKDDREPMVDDLRLREPEAFAAVSGIVSDLRAGLQPVDAYGLPHPQPTELAQWEANVEWFKARELVPGPASG